MKTQASSGKKMGGVEAVCLVLMVVVVALLYFFIASSLSAIGESIRMQRFEEIGECRMYLSINEIPHERVMGICR